MPAAGQGGERAKVASLKRLTADNRRLSVQHPFWGDVSPVIPTPQAALDDPRQCRRETGAPRWRSAEAAAAARQEFTLMAGPTRAKALPRGKPVTRQTAKGGRKARQDSGFSRMNGASRASAPGPPAHARVTERFRYWPFRVLVRCETGSGDGGPASALATAAGKRDRPESPPPMSFVWPATASARGSKASPRPAGMRRAKDEEDWSG
jgi:hypothetical protein